MSPLLIAVLVALAVGIAYNHTLSSSSSASEPPKQQASPLLVGGLAGVIAYFAVTTLQSDSGDDTAEVMKYIALGNPDF